MRKNVVVVFVAVAMAMTVASSGCSNDEVTKADTKEMSEGEITQLVACQINKHEEEVGEKKADEFFKDFMDDYMKDENTEPLQERYIDEGVSCTEDEMEKYPKHL